MSVRVSSRSRLRQFAAPLSISTIVLILLAGCGGSSDGGNVELEVSGVWSRPVELMNGGMDMQSDTATESETEGPEHENTLANGPTAVVYLTIENTGDIDDILLGASSEVAEIAELHESSMNDGVMQMRPVTAIEIPSGDTVSLEPGGYHIMLIGLKEDLEVGDTFDITLDFEEYGSMTVTSEVRNDF